MYGKPAFALIALTSLTFMGVPSGSSLAAGLPQAIRPNVIRSFGGSTTPHRGSLDPSFGNGGKVLTVGTGQCGARGALQPDSKIIVVTCGSNNAMQLIRYLANGSPDASFGKGGVDVTGLKGGGIVALQTDGKILVLGKFDSASGSVGRFNSNGTLDGSFGRGGIADITLPGGETTTLVVQSDGRIVVGVDEPFSSGKIGLVRFLPNGVLDSTFGQSGIAIINELGQVVALAVAQDGTTDALISDVGSMNGESTYPVHFCATGSFIAAPPSGNLVMESTFSQDTFEPDAEIICIPGVGNRGGIRNVRLTKFNTPDPSFQRPFYTFGPNSTPLTTTIEPDGGILTAGGEARLANAFDLERFNPNGSIDSGFGSGGEAQTKFFPGGGFGGNAAIVTLLLQPDSKIVAVGVAFNSANKGGIALARYFGLNHSSVVGSPSP